MAAIRVVTSTMASTSKFALRVPRAMGSPPSSSLRQPLFKIPPPPTGAFQLCSSRSLHITAVSPAAKKAKGKGVQPAHPSLTPRTSPTQAPPKATPISKATTTAAAAASTAGQTMGQKAAPIAAATSSQASKPTPQSSTPAQTPPPPNASQSQSPSLTSTEEGTVLYEGPPVGRAALFYVTWLTFVASGVMITLGLAQHLVWPPWSPTAELISPNLRWFIGGILGGLCVFAGGMFKTSSTKNITRIVLKERAGGVPWLTIRTCTGSWLPRSLGKTLPWSKLPLNIPIEPRLGKEFSVPLQHCTRAKGSAVAQGSTVGRLKQSPRSKNLIFINIGNSIHALDGSDVAKPTPEGKSRWRYWLLRFNWKVLRAAPEPPKFWDRQAFDELFPLRNTKAV